MTSNAIANDPSALLPAVIAVQTPTAVALATSELRYRRLSETAKDGILILDAETVLVVEDERSLRLTCGLFLKAQASHRTPRLSGTQAVDC